MMKEVDEILSDFFEADCPIRGHQYGGLPSWGDFSSNTEYEIGGGKILEAVHCILGSLGRHLGKNMDDWDSMKRTEKGHILEEFGIIQKTLKEYSKDLYTDTVTPGSQRWNDEYGTKSVETLKNTKLDRLIGKLRDDAKAQTDIPEDIKAVAIASYNLAGMLVQKIRKGFDDFPEIIDNAYADPEVTKRMRTLEKTIKDLYK
jgi:hypothetical protein